MVFEGPKYVKQKLPLKPVIIIWNLFLCVFSTYGSCRMLPVLYYVLPAKGYDGLFNNLESVQFCDVYGVTCIWLCIFCASKIPELIDTVWLILSRKRVIFLHWFHHVTVLMFCWISWANLEPTGFIYATMNFFVHSFMYFYYFLAIIPGLRPSFFRPLITWLQIIQMILGSAAAFYSMWRCFIATTAEGECKFKSPMVAISSVLMYLAYLFLFLKFFVDTYCGPPKERS